ncbi:MAG: cysteine synthase family protein [Chloroflexi bacterium]|nr:cysteine synthase family protein [Chloroflexota bacterium]
MEKAPIRSEAYPSAPMKTIAPQDNTARDLFAQIGNTPLLSFRRITAHLPADVQLYAKAEWHNPGGSVKDRAAYAILCAGEARGELTRDKILVDSTSGNTGIAFAMLGAALDYRVRLYVPENVSGERLAILRAYGAGLELTDPAEGSDGALLAVRAAVRRQPERYFYADQYGNAANWQAHYRSTAPEIWQQTGGQVTHFVAGIGTSGTLMGTGRRLRELREELQVIAVQPASPLHGLEGLKHMDSALLPAIYDPDFADAQLRIQTEWAQDMSRRLAREEGCLVGTSAAAAVVASLQLAERVAERGESACIVTILPDSGTKYLSQSIW